MIFYLTLEITSGDRKELNLIMDFKKNKYEKNYAYFTRCRANCRSI
jgi:hypothetical protein